MEIRETVSTVCSSCEGTGLCPDLMYENDLVRMARSFSIICQTCLGTGCTLLTYRPFNGRVRMKDPSIKWVSLPYQEDRATNTYGNVTISINDFYANKIPIRKGE